MTQRQRIAKTWREPAYLPKVSIRTVQMFENLNELFHRFIDFRENIFYIFSGIYVLLTYVYYIFDEVPYLSILGLKASGKSRLGDMFEGLCFNPINTGDLSDASLYRAITEQRFGLTMIIDEADDLSGSKRRSILLRVLRSGYRRTGNVMRCSPSGGTERFPTFCPKIIINEGGIQDAALESRTIPIHMFKTDRPLEQFQFERVSKEFKEIRDQICSFVNDYGDLIRNRYLSFEGLDGVSDRDEEVWGPIIVIADILATLLDRPSIKEEMVALAKKVVVQRKRNQLVGNRDLQILESTRAFIGQKESPNQESSALGEDLRDFIKVRWDIASLSTEAAVRTLNRYKVIKKVRRPRLEVKENGLKRVVQKSCYEFDEEILLKLTGEYFEGGE